MIFCVPLRGMGAGYQNSHEQKRTKGTIVAAKHPEKTHIRTTDIMTRAKSTRAKGSSVSTTDISWLKRFVVTPMSVREKNATGAFMTECRSRAWRASELKGTMTTRNKLGSPCDAQGSETGGHSEQPELVVAGGLARLFRIVCPEAEHECRHLMTSRVHNDEGSEQYGVPYRDGAKVICVCGKLAEDSTGRFRVVADLVSIYCFASGFGNSLMAILHRCFSCVPLVDRAVLLDCQPMQVGCTGLKLGE